MQKTTFNLKAILIFTFLIHSFVNFAQDKRVEISYQSTGDELNLKSESHPINYKNTSPFVMLSAYTKDLSYTDIVYYRLMTDNTWEEWIPFQDSHEGETVDRKVFAPIYINQAFDDIQFKTEIATNSEFIFRLFFPESSKKKVKKKRCFFRKRSS